MCLMQTPPYDLEEDWLDDREYDVALPDEFTDPADRDALWDGVSEILNTYQEELKAGRIADGTEESTWERLTRRSSLVSSPERR